MKDKRITLFNIIRGFAAILIALAVATVFIFLSFILSDKGYSVGESVGKTFEALYYMLVKPLVATGGGLNTRNLAQVLAAMIPTIFTGLATCVMFSAKQFNLAAEGNVMAGGFVAALCGIYLPISSGLHVWVCILIATVVCALVMLLPALLKVKLGASEMVISLMLNYIIQFIVLYFLNDVFADRSKGSTQTFPFQATAKVGMLDESSKLSYGFIAAIVIAILVGLFMYRTRWGYSIRMVGINKSFAKYSGLNVGRTIVVSQLIGGALAGMGGAIEVLGRFNTFLWRELPGYGWTGVTIAILAKNNPFFVPFAAFFMAYLDKGCMLMATYCDVPSEMMDIIQAAIFLFFAADQFLSGYRQKLVVKNTQADLAKAKVNQEGSVK